VLSPDPSDLVDLKDYADYRDYFDHPQDYAKWVASGQPWWADSLGKFLQPAIEIERDQ
jgi:hypothetical protein